MQATVPGGRRSSICASAGLSCATAPPFTTICASRSRSTARFSLHRDSFELNEIAVKALHSTLNLQAELPSFSRPDWNFKYRGRLSLADVRSVTRHPTTPDGDVDFSGQAHYAPR